MKKNKIYLCFLALSLIGVVGFYIIPFFISIFYSFINGIYDYDFVGFKNYVDLFQTETFKISILNTIKFVFIALPSLLFISLLTAILFNYVIKNNFIYANKLLTVNLLSMAIPVASVILLVNILFGNYGAINNLLTNIGYNKVLWFSSDKQFFLLFLLYIWHNCSCCMLVFLSGLSQIDNAILEAADLDGANYYQKFYSIILIDIYPQIIFNIIIGIIGIFKLYRESYLLFGDYPDKSIYMIQNFLNNNFMNLNYQKLSAASTVFLLGLIVPIYYLIFIYNEKD